MTDRELLERAARAGGMKVLTVPWPSNPEGWFWCEHSNKGAGLFLHHDVSKGWTPLTDDGDALRLAVALRLSVCHHHNGDNPAVTAMVPMEWHGKFMEADEPHGDDICAATRRAIVRAAAAMAPEEAE